MCVCVGGGAIMCVCACVCGDSIEKTQACYVHITDEVYDGSPW